MVQTMGKTWNAWLRRARLFRETCAWERVRRRGSLRAAVRVSAPVLGLTGYEQHSRKMIEGLAGLGVHIGLTGLEQWTSQRLPGAADVRWEALVRPVKAAIHFHSCMPQSLRCSPGLPNIHYTMFESTRICQAWAEAARPCARVVVPTEFSRRAWTAAGVAPEKVVTCPLGVDGDLFRPGARPRRLRLKDGRDVASFRHRVLHMSDASGRKNMPALLRAWMLGTRRDDNAVLILKLSFFWKGGREVFSRDIAEAEAELGRPLHAAAPVCLLDDSLGEREMPGVYTAATHYWSMSHGEGFDLPMHEAAACGLQLLAPAHSAYLDYLDPSIAHLIPAKEAPAVLRDDPLTSEFFTGSFWWDPEVEAAASLLRDLAEGKLPPTRPAREVLTPRYTWEATARRLAEILFN